MLKYVHIFNARVYKYYISLFVELSNVLRQ